MVSTIDDYVRFLETLRKGGAPILKPETARQIAENAIGDISVTQAGEGWGWSLGLSILKDQVAAKTPQTAGTWWWGGAYGHVYFVDPIRRMTVIWLTNTAMAGGPSGEFPKELVNAIYGK